MEMISGPYGMESACVPFEDTDLEMQLREAVRRIHGSIALRRDPEEELVCCRAVGYAYLRRLFDGSQPWEGARSKGRADQ